MNDNLTTSLNLTRVGILCRATIPHINGLFNKPVRHVCHYLFLAMVSFDYPIDN
jgi:hypothetical protein